VHLELGRRELGKKQAALKIVHTCIHELDIPFYYEHHALCKSLKLPPTSISSLINALRSNGFSAGRTHFSSTAIKTNARIDELKTFLKALSTEL